MRKLEKNINMRLKNEFTKNLFTATLLQLKYTSNPIRYNSFAFSFRELVRHIFYQLAPDEDVENCSWYTNSQISNGITRAQRITYAVRGGLSDDFLNKELNIDLRTLTKQILKSIDKLNKYTHIEEDVFHVSENDGDKLVNNSLNSLIDFFTAIDEIRDSLIDKYEHILFKVIDEIFTEEIFNEIDILSTHHSIDVINLDKIEVQSIDSKKIYIKVSGTVYVEHQYGSNRDVKNGFGDIFSNSYPFLVITNVNVKTPLDISINPAEIEIDNNNFFK